MWFVSTRICCPSTNMKKSQNYNTRSRNGASTKLYERQMIKKYIPVLIPRSSFIWPEIFLFSFTQVLEIE